MSEVGTEPPCSPSQSELGDFSPVFSELNRLPEAEAVAAIVEALRARPELAHPVVLAACPELSFAPQKALTERREVGVIKSFNVKKGYGFVQSDGVTEMFGGDAFLHKRQMANFNVGETVSFGILLSDDYKPQAFDLQPVGASTTTPPLPPPPPPLPPPVPPRSRTPRSRPRALSSRALPRDAPDDLLSRRFRGTLKSFNTAAGFGFVDCSETHTLFGRDVFVGKDTVRDVSVGSQVSFSLILNQKGQPQARKLRRHANGPPRAPSPPIPAPRPSTRRSPVKDRTASGRPVFTGAKRLRD